MGVGELEQIKERESKQAAVTGHRMAGVAGAKYIDAGGHGGAIAEAK